MVPDIPDGRADHKNRIVACLSYHLHTLQQAAISMSYYMFAKQISISYYMFAEQKLSSSPSSLSLMLAWRSFSIVHFGFLATLVALHFTPVSESVSG